jgi:hypothetical protein
MRVGIWAVYTPPAGDCYSPTGKKTCICLSGVNFKIFVTGNLAEYSLKISWADMKVLDMYPYTSAPISGCVAGSSGQYAPNRGDDLGPRLGNL